MVTGTSISFSPKPSTVPSWLLVALGFYATFLVMKRVTRPRRSQMMTMMSDEEEDEDDFDLDDYTDESMARKDTEGSK